MGRDSFMKIPNVNEALCVIDTIDCFMRSKTILTNLLTDSTLEITIIQRAYHCLF